MRHQGEPTKQPKQSNNNNNQDTAEEIRYISSLINQDKFQDALERIENYERQHPNDKTLQFNKLGFLVDIGFGLNDQHLVRQALDIGEHNLENHKYPEHDSNIHYNLANGYFSLYELAERRLGIESIPQSANLQKAKVHFREALALCDESKSDFEKRVLVNYGNCLGILGRGVEALTAYDKAITIDEHFSMAIGNKAKALRSFADISGEYRGAIYVEAYQAIESILDNQDLIAIGGWGARKSFENELQKIASHFEDKKDLARTLEHSKYSTTNLSEFEKYYLAFCAKEKLFLNFHLHNTQCKSAIVDSIFIRVITPIEDNDTFYQLAKYINQIKEDYATARLLLVQSQFRREDFDNISRRTTFANTLDYSQFNLYFGLLKSAFKEAYNILDKIAVFINNYYKLELTEEKIHFTWKSPSIWQKDKKIRDEIRKSRNMSLYALYDIFQDFEHGYYESIKDIRDASTHRKLVIFDSMILTDWDKTDEENIGYSTMLHEMIDLLKLTKSAIIYLVNFVNNEEDKKRSGELIVPMFVDTSQFLS